jgi:hypothetical protein
LKRSEISSNGDIGILVMNTLFPWCWPPMISTSIVLSYKALTVSLVSLHEPFQRAPSSSVSVCVRTRLAVRPFPGSFWVEKDDRPETSAWTSPRGAPQITLCSVWFSFHSLCMVHGVHGLRPPSVLGNRQWP